MKISRFINLFLITIALLLSILVALASQVLGTLDNIGESERHRYKSLLLANELLQSSEDLTRMARSYVATGDPIYEDYFYGIHAIRNGKQPRPQDYSAIHWHLVDADRIVPAVSALGDAISLQELMQGAGLSGRELNLLQQSQSNSDTLVELEKQAFAAMQGLYDDGHGNFTVQRAPDRNFALDLLFNESYHAEKSRIMAPLKQFMQELDNRTQVTLSDLQSEFQQQTLLILAVLCSALLGTAAVALYAHRNILRPLSYLNRQTSSIAQSQYAARCSIQTHNEFSELGADFNSMAEAIERDISTREQAERMLRERFYAIRRNMTQESSMDKFCHEVVMHLKGAMQFPQIASAMIEFDGRRFTSENYSQDLAHGLHASITVNGEEHGWLQVFYSEDRPFLLPEEQGLIDAIASDLGRWLERLRTEQCIVEMATHDALTGLPNRTLFRDRITQALAHDRRNQEQAAVLFIDLDHFKVVNDSLGHDVGDSLLKEVAIRLAATVRSEDSVARQGGDEFIVLLPNIIGARDAAMAAQKILDALIQPFYIHDKELYIGGSIGIAMFPSDGEDVNTLLKSGDIAMYHAKGNGRNNYQFFTPEMNLLAAERHSLGIYLRHALERHELLLNYQPVIDMPGGKLISLEVLLR